MWRSFLPILCYIFTKDLNSTETYALVSKMVRFLQKQRRVSQIGSTIKTVSFYSRIFAFKQMNIS